MTIEILDGKGQVVQTIQGAAARARVRGAGRCAEVRAVRADARRWAEDSRGGGGTRTRRAADGVDGGGPESRDVGPGLSRAP